LAGLTKQVADGGVMEFTMSQFISKEEMYEYEIERLHDLNAELIETLNLAQSALASTAGKEIRIKANLAINTAIAKVEQP
jgi:hypothetical protein